MTICHIISETDWKKAQDEGSYQPASLQLEGFIHFSTPQQVLATASRFYAHQSGLLLLFVETGQLTSELCYESAAGTAEQFPHLYGPLNLEAVVDVQPFPVNEAGTFLFPTAWQKEL
jgi:uncharacterized protein (DUF952 family)